MDPKNLIINLIDRICVPELCVGSPSYGVIKYQMCAYDLEILKEQHIMAEGETHHKFGRRIRSGAYWTSWEISCVECLAQVHRLDSGYMQNRLPNISMQDHVDWVGDINILQDVHTYLDLIQT